MLPTLCPSCGHQNKVKGFCTRCGLNLMLLPLRNVLKNINSVETAELNQGIAPNLVTRRLDAVPTQMLTPRITMTERATIRFHEAITATTKQARPYVSVMLFLTLLVFVTAFALWRSVHVPTQNVAYAAAGNAPTLSPTPTPLVLPSPVSLWTVIEDQTQAVTNSVNALVEDQQFAVIEPNGQLALELTDDQFFGNSTGADIKIHGESAQQTAYRIFVRNDAQATWQRIDVNRKGFAQGAAQHDMGHHGIHRARQILIRNDSSRPLLIDGLKANYPNLVPAAPASSQKVVQKQALSRSRGFCYHRRSLKYEAFFSQKGTNKRWQQRAWKKS